MAAKEKPKDKELWRSKRRGVVMANEAENDRVRAIVREELERVVAADQRVWSDKRKFGAARTALATDWWEIAQKEEGLRPPGAGQRQHAMPGEDVRKRQIDAGRTAIRHLLAGELISDWMLVGIESAICERHGMPLPGAAYRSQRQLSL